MNYTIKVFFVLLISYGLGSLCGGHYICKLIYNKDLKTVSSGNLGAINASRVLGKKGFLLTFTFDFVKGIFAVMIGKYFDIENVGIYLVILAVIAGHIFPAQLDFKGGKGISTFLGAIFFYDYHIVLILVGLFLVIFILVRKFTISGLLALLLTPLVMILFRFTFFDIVGIIINVSLIFYAHRENISHYLDLVGGNHEDKI